MITVKRAAEVLACWQIDDEQFFEVTGLLAARFAQRDPDRDFRYEPAAPAVFYDWFRHAGERVPDFRVWHLSAQLERFLDPAGGLTFPRNWPWYTRDRLFDCNVALRSRTAWVPAFNAAASEVSDATEQWFDSLRLTA